MRFGAWWRQIGEGSYFGPNQRVIKGSAKRGSGTDSSFRNVSTGDAQCLLLFTIKCATADQYAYVELYHVATTAKSYVIFRYTDQSSPYYILIFDTTADTVTWRRQNLAGTIDDLIGSASYTLNLTSWFTVTIAGTDDATTIRIWDSPPFPLNDTRSATDVGGDTTPTITMTDNPATPVNGGPYVGIGVSGVAASDAQLGWFEGGDTAPAAISLLSCDFTTHDELVPSSDMNASSGRVARIRGVERMIYTDAQTDGFVGYCNSLTGWNLVNGEVYVRMYTEHTHAWGGCRLKIESTEQSGWQANMSSTSFRVVRYLTGYTGGTEKDLDTGVDPNLYRWIRFRVSADGLTLYWDRAPDLDDDEKAPGTWVNLGSNVLSETPDFHAERIQVALDISGAASGETGDKVTEFSCLNKSLTPPYPKYIACYSSYAVSGTGTAITTGEVTYLENTVYILVVFNKVTGSTANTPTVDGWTQITTQQGGSSRQTVTAFRKSSTSRTNTHIINFAGQSQTIAHYHITVIEGSRRSGVAGANAIVQSATNSAASGTEMSATLAPLSNPDRNIVLLYTSTANNAALSQPDEGQGIIFDLLDTLSSSAQYHISGDISPSRTAPGSAEWAAVAMEIAVEQFENVSWDSSGKLQQISTQHRVRY